MCGIAVVWSLEPFSILYMFAEMSSTSGKTVSLSDVNALREEVKHLMELIQKLIMEFRAVRLEVEASHLDIMESVTLAVATCMQSRANNP